MQRSTFPSAQRACWDWAGRPGPAAAAGAQPVGPDPRSVAGAYTCRGLSDMQGSSDEGVFIITYSRSLSCSEVCNRTLSPSFNDSFLNTFQFEDPDPSLSTSAPHCSHSDHPPCFLHGSPNTASTCVGSHHNHYFCFMNLKLQTWKSQTLQSDSLSD